MFLGLDLGTSGLRGLLIDQNQSIVAVAEASYRTARLHPGWSEQSPQDWLSACEKVISSLKAGAASEMSALKGIGVSGHMHGATLLDGQNDVLRPCILWNDTRSADQAARLDGSPGIREISGNIVFPGFTAPKLIWVAEHEPQIADCVATVLLPKDYVNLWLTGVIASDMSDAAGTAWLDTGARTWSPQVLSASGLAQDQMPPLREGTAPIGTVRPDLAAELGLPPDVVVAAGAADNAAAACGIGALAEGDGFVSLGTSGVLLAARNRYAPNPASAVHTFCHAVPDRWYQMGVMLSATDSLNWLARSLDTDAAELTRELGDSIAPPGEVKFLPYLSGERTPHNDGTVRGALLGLDIGTARRDLTRAVLEGVSFGMRDCLNALATTGVQLDRLIAVGGGSRSPYWVELLATILNLPLDVPAQSELGAALGAARLAICASTGAAPQDVMTKPAIAQTVVPRADLTGDYAEAFATYQTLYPGIRALTT